jgi:DNA-binding winged helix-turn-helix (wHTH) protein
MKVGFGAHVLDTDTRELTRGGRPVPLSPLAFRLLLALVENRPKALSKAALNDLLWPDTVVVDANLSNLVAEVRAALGEDSRRPRFIRTLHRFGYAFRDEVAPAPAPAIGVRVALRWPGGRAVLGSGEHVLGRDADLPVCLTSASVSRRHALLRVAGDAVTLEDLGSKNGTWVNGQRIEAARAAALADADEVRAGSVHVVVRVLAPSLSTETHVEGGRESGRQRRGDR